MVTMQISVSETAAKLIERTVREKQYAGPSEYIEGLVEADHASGPTLRVKSEFPVAMESDPAADIEVTPEYWEAKQQRLETMVADDLDVDPEHRKWINAQLLEALEADSSEGFPMTPEFFANWRQEVEEKLAEGAAR